MLSLVLFAISFAIETRSFPIGFVKENGIAVPAEKRSKMAGIAGVNGMPSGIKRRRIAAVHSPRNGHRSSAWRRIDCYISSDIDGSLCEPMVKRQATAFAKEGPFRKKTRDQILGLQFPLAISTDSETIPAALERKIHATLRTIGHKLAQTFRFRSTVNVRVVGFDDFQGSVGISFTSCYVMGAMLGRDTATLAYPVSLAKQFTGNSEQVIGNSNKNKNNKQLQFSTECNSSHDILIKVNTAYHYWAKGDTDPITQLYYRLQENNEPISDQNIDLEFVLAHELIHGLGFDSSSFRMGSFLYPGYYQARVSSVAQDNIVTQDSNVTQQGATPSHSGDTMAKWLPPTVFESRLHDQYGPIMDRMNTIRATKVPGKEYNYKTQDPSYTSQSPVVFKTLTGNASIMVDYIDDPSSCLSHLSDIYIGSNDFLMTATAFSGVSVDELARPLGSEIGPVSLRHGNNLIGPVTVDILNAIGWELWTDDPLDHVFLPMQVVPMF